MMQSETPILEDKLGAHQLVFSNKDVTVNIFNLVGDIFLWGLSISAVTYLTRAEKI